MALIGPEPTEASVSSLVRGKDGSELDEVLQEVVQFTDGPPLTNLAANAATRAKLVAFLAPPRLDGVFTDLKETSDPKFTALSWLADEVDPLRGPILKLVIDDLLDSVPSEPTTVDKLPVPAALTILTRLLARGKLEDSLVTDDVVRAVIPYVASKDRHWATLATVFLKSAASRHGMVITSTVKKDLASRNQSTDNSDEAFAVVAALVDVLPALADIIWSIDLAPYRLEPSDNYLRMLSSLCNTKDNRDRVAQNAGSAIAAQADKGSLLAAVIDAKIQAGTTSLSGDVKSALARLDKLSQNVFEDNVTEDTLEGLACTAMLASVRQRASKATGATIPALCDLIKRSPETSYAIVSILVQLAYYPIKTTKEEERKKQLRIKALGETPADVEEKPGQIEARKYSAKICDAVLTTGLVSWLSTNVSRLSPASREQIAYLLRELASHQEHSRREKQGIQGSVIIAMYLWANDNPRLDAHMLSVAAATVGKIMASITPQVALTDKVPRRIVIAPLCDQLFNESSDRPNLETFEALLALTNLSSIEDGRLRADLSRRVWPKLKRGLTSEYMPIQRASLELTCNLMLVNTSAEHFLQYGQESRNLLSLLGQSVLLDDRDARIAASGALAILSEWETAPEFVGHNKACVECLSKAVGKFVDDDELLVRVLTAITNLIKGTTSLNDDEVVESIIHYGGVNNVETLLEYIDPVKHQPVAKLLVQIIRLMAEYKLRSS